ncbi:MAG: hypothetical protein JWO70_1979 [Betaproteobacteria bacterium]|nr:hypothetical protein [Betaproteobacteria bacterium]
MSLQETLNPDLLHKRLLTALAANREPGFHFPGYFLDLTWPHIGTQSVEQAMDTGPHCVDREGVVIPAALAVVVDGALATAPRLVIEPGARLATVHLDMQYTGMSRAARSTCRLRSKASSRETRSASRFRAAC